MSRKLCSSADLAVSSSSELQLSSSIASSLKIFVGLKSMGATASAALTFVSCSTQETYTEGSSIISKLCACLR